MQAWLEKLITEPANNVERKRTRNIYLTQLLLQLKEGRLQGTLADMPPEGSLIPAKEVFTSLNLPPTKTAHDLEMETALDLTNLRYVSKDGRTYLATKSLDKDSGVCGYLAVSIGEESKGLWLDSRGRPRQLEKGSNNMAENVPNTSPVTDDAKLEEQTISVLLQKRLSEEDRLKLKKFYEDVLARIDKILKSANQGKEKMEIKDPVIKEMIERIKCETPTVGNVLCAPADFHGLTLLKALRKKVICKLEDIQDRSNLIECISKQVAYQGKEPYKIVDLSKKISDPLANNVWKNVQIYRPAKSDSISLIATYGERLVQAYREMNGIVYTKL
ncbi:hypothetical protein O3M35_002457 [Rhynocoris fuscipes]|uniref:DUF4485 domain-containing protein n=1 Tax=Rhynocoris fuscipes TaxID=488301 RepID=A0AAW1CKD3_9HEMI